jgi:hypothetical protein
MPDLSEAEIRAKIADGTIFGLSIDTAVFDKYGCNLDFPVLKKLDQFKGSSIALLFSEIVVNEIKNHIARDAQETQRELKKAIRNQGKRWKTSIDVAKLPDALALLADPIKVAENQIRGYIAAVGGEIVPANDAIDIPQELLRRYFTVEPPFENNDQKKHEFPDGFALLSLEAVARQKQKLLLCVSPDGGWKDFATQSSHLVCITDLEAALSFFNDSDRTVADQLMELWRKGKAPKLDTEVEHAFEYRLGDLNFYTDSSSPFEFEAEPTSAVMQSVDLETASPPVVIAADEKSVTFTINVKALVAFEAEFRFYVKDSIDKDYVALGSEVQSVEQDVEFQLAITVLRDISTEPDVLYVEVAEKRIEIDFGYVQLFADEDPTFEKY